MHGHFYGLSFSFLEQHYTIIACQSIIEWNFDLIQFWVCKVNINKQALIFSIFFSFLFLLFFEKHLSSLTFENLSFWVMGFDNLVLWKLGNGCEDLGWFDLWDLRNIDLTTYISIWVWFEEHNKGRKSRIFSPLPI